MCSRSCLMSSTLSSKPIANRAFGLIELMVSISIMALLTTIVVTRQSSFNGAVLLRNQAYEVAFTLRQAQMLAVSGGDEATRRYGVYFDTSTAAQHTYVLFGDTNNNGMFDAGEQIGLTGKLDRRFEIRSLTAPDITTLQGVMSITFLRPNFDGYFCTNASGCTTPAAYTSGTASVHVARTDVTTNGTGDVRRVEVTRTGQIAVVTY
jgi:prepilin-type N-terminal cleavage/methylation domain-containing protein